ASYLTGESRGVKMNVQLTHPEEKRVYALGQKMFFYRGGAYDFACATCHAVDGQRIRLQDLPNLLESKGAQAAYTTWPAYRVSQGEVRTMQHRIYDCLRQQRFPEPAYGSDVITALSMFLAKNANGGTYDGPNMKR
ncbi:sulfur oxidation c-type cytochrome SoxA, partial [Pseudomonas sp. KB_15]